MGVRDSALDLVADRANRLHGVPPRPADEGGEFRYRVDDDEPRPMATRRWERGAGHVAHVHARQLDGHRVVISDEEAHRRFRVGEWAPGSAYAPHLELPESIAQRIRAEQDAVGGMLAPALPVLGWV